MSVGPRRLLFDTDTIPAAVSHRRLSGRSVPSPMEQTELGAVDTFTAGVDRADTGPVRPDCVAQLIGAAADRLRALLDEQRRGAG